MFNNLKVQEIEKIIGYEFKDKSLLVRAFTHPSLKPDVTENYQTIEFLGDSILDFIVAEKLMELHPTLNEGFLTKMRAQVVSEQPLADAIGRIRIAEFMQFGMGERRHKIYENDSIKCDLFESIVGAIYLDGGLIEARKFIEKYFNLADYKNMKDQNFKSKLQELVQGNFKCKMTYKTLPCDDGFTSTFLMDEDEISSGKGKSKAEAEQMAAKLAIEKLFLL